MKMKKALLFLVPLPMFAVVNDIFPTDYNPLPQGTVVATIYLSNTNVDGFYSNKSKVLSDNISIQSSTLRLSQMLKINNNTFAPMLVASYSQGKSSGDMSPVFGKASGATDLRIGGTYWLIEQSDISRFLAITATVAMPTGQYNPNKLLNPGENRYKGIINIGHIEPLSKNIKLDIALEGVKYFANNNSQNKRVTQDNTYSITSYLRYELPFGFQPYIGIQSNYGGETYKNSVPQNDETKNVKEMLGVVYTNPNIAQFQLRYGRDILIQNGLKTGNEIAFTILRWF